MSRRRSPRNPQNPDVSREAIIEALLDDLCVKFGFCLDPLAKEALHTNPPPDASAFTDRVISAEGLNPITVDTALRNGMIALVETRAAHVL